MKKFKDLSLKVKMGLMSVTYIIFLLIVGFVGYYVISSLVSAKDELVVYSEIVKNQLLLGRMADKIDADIYRAIFIDKTNQLEMQSFATGFNAHYQNMETAYKKLDILTKKTNDNREFEKINEHYKKYSKLAIQIKDLTLHNDFESITLIGPFKQSYININIETSKLEVFFNNKSHIVENKVHKLSALAQISIILAVFLAFLISGLLIPFIITRNIVNDLGGEPTTIRNIADEIAKGNLCLQFNETTDDVSVYSSMKKMSNQLLNTQTKLYQSIQEIEEARQVTEIKNTELLQIQSELTLNIEELKSTQEQMRIAKEQAEMANKAKSEFLANMSHEIRTPLNAIVGFSQILIKRAIRHELPVSFRQQIENIKISGQNLSELINNILDLSKIEAGKMALSLEPINIKQLFQSIYHIFKNKASEKDLEFSYDFDNQIPHVIETDRTKINQILVNLTGNAIKFTPHGKSVKITAEKAEEFLLIKVIDTGIGIAEEKKKLVFEAFEQADNTVTRQYGGSGLGLTITKNLVKLLNGEIWFESELEKGTTFYLKIPLIVSTSDILKTDDYDFTKISFSKENIILIAEDNDMNQAMIGDLFKELGLDVNFANNGLEAIKLTKQLNPDIILMDMHMPVMDGMAATEHIRQIPEFKNIPIIAISADAFLEQQKQAILRGLSYYITKPIDFLQLIPILEKHLKLNGVLLPDTTVEKPEVSVEINKIIEIEIEKLMQIPSFKFKDFIRQLSEITKLYEGFKNPNQNIFQKIEDAAFSGNEELIRNCINTLKNGNKNINC